MMDEKTYQLIDAYLRNSLNDEDRISFEKRMASEEVLQQEVTIQKGLYEAVGAMDSTISSEETQQRLEAIKSTLNSEENQKIARAIEEAHASYNAPKVLPLNRKAIFTIAASLLVLISLYFFTLGNDNTLALYEDYKQWEHLPSLTERDEASSLLAKGEEDFLKKDFEAAIKALEHYQDSNMLNPQVLAYLGASYLELDQFEKAHDNFDALIKSGTLDSSKGMWYKVLVYLKSEDKGQALTLLEAIITNPANYNYDQAKALLEDLK